MPLQTVRYRIFPKNPGAHLFEVTCVISAPDPAGQKLRLPAWIPGSYMIREFAKHIVQLKMQSGGRAVATLNPDHTWQCIRAWRQENCISTTPLGSGRAATSAPMVSSTARVSSSQYWGEKIEFTKWKSCPLRRRVSPLASRYCVKSAGAEPYGFGLYRADTYDELVDHPVEMGTFTLAQFEAVESSRHRYYRAPPLRSQAP
jgi:predicted metalloprotease with PDZ domain